MTDSKHHNKMSQHSIQNNKKHTTQQVKCYKTKTNDCHYIYCKYLITYRTSGDLVWSILPRKISDPFSKSLEHMGPH